MPRIHVLFNGKVQGVGFRNTTAKWATRLGIKGWVRNLPDGSVEMLADGESEHLQMLTEQLNAKFQIDEKITKEPSKEDHFTDFKILR